MRLFFAFLLSGFLFATPGPHADLKFRYKLQLLSQSASEFRETLGWLSSQGFDISGVLHPQRQIEVIADLKDITALNKHGLHGHTERHLLPLSKVNEGYLNPQKVEDQLKTLQTQYPNRARRIQIGTSFEGRAIWALKISTDLDANESRPTMLFDGMHHARELMTSEIVMDAAVQILNGAVDDVLSRWDILLIPMLNVDGNNRVWTSNSYWRKNARAENSDIFGVDLNRNYPFEWNHCYGSSAGKHAETYRGDRAASEPETNALIQLAAQVRPAASLSYHSYGEMVLYPYGCENELSTENGEFASVAEAMASRLGHYTAGTPWQLLYSVDGDSMSYIHATYGAIALSFEVGQDFQPPYSERDKAVELQRTAWIYFLKHIDQNLLTVELQSPARVEISSLPTGAGVEHFETSADGRMFKVLAPGRYQLDFGFEDGHSETLEIEMKGSPKTVRIP